MKIERGQFFTVFQEPIKIILEKEQNHLKKKNKNDKHSLV